MMVCNNISLDDITVGTPCTESWDGMEGDDRVRFCSRCRQHVFNFSEMTQNEIESLVTEADGRRCVRFFRRPDGTMLTKDCTTTRRPVRRMPATLAALLIVLFAMLTIAILDACVPGKRRISDWLDSVVEKMYPLPQGPPRDWMIMGDAKIRVDTEEKLA